MSRSLEFINARILWNTLFLRKIIIKDMKSTQKHTLFVAGFILIVCLSRLIPHEYNFTPVAALCLFGGAVFLKNSYRFIIPLIAIFISDFLLNNFVYNTDDSITLFSNFMIWTYGSYLLIVALGMLLLRKNRSVLKILISGIAAGVIFFLITNFGSWLYDPVYPKNLLGLLESYQAGIPFFRNTFYSNILFSLIFFVSYDLITQKKTDALAEEPLNV